MLFMGSTTGREVSTAQPIEEFRKKLEGELRQSELLLKAIRKSEKIAESEWSKLDFVARLHDQLTGQERADELRRAADKKLLKTVERRIETLKDFLGGGFKKLETEFNQLVSHGKKDEATALLDKYRRDISGGLLHLEEYRRAESKLEHKFERWSGGIQALGEGLEALRDNLKTGGTTAGSIRFGFLGGAGIGMGMEFISASLDEIVKARSEGGSADGILRRISERTASALPQIGLTSISARGGHALGRIVGREALPHLSKTGVRTAAGVASGGGSASIGGIAGAALTYHQLRQAFEEEMKDQNLSAEAKRKRFDAYLTANKFTASEVAQDIGVSLLVGTLGGGVGGRLSAYEDAAKGVHRVGVIAVDILSDLKIGLGGAALRSRLKGTELTFKDVANEVAASAVARVQGRMTGSRVTEEQTIHEQVAPQPRRSTVAGTMAKLWDAIPTPDGATSGMNGGNLRSKAASAVRSDSTAPSLMKAQTLSPQEFSAVEDFTTRWLQNAIQNGLTADPGANRIPFKKTLHEPLAHLVGELEEWNQGRYPQKYRKALGIFSKRLIEAIESLQLSGHEEKAQRLALSIEQLGLSWSPGMFSGLPPIDKLLLASNAARSPLLQATLGQGFIGDIVQDLSNGGMRQFTNELPRTFSALPPLERMDVTKTLQTVIGESLSRRDSLLSNTFQNLHGLLRTLHAIERTPIVQYQLALALERSATELSHPSVGIAKRSHDPSNSRLPETIPEEMLVHSAQLRRMYNFNVLPPNELVLYALAPGYVATIDHAGAIQHIGNVGRSTSHEPRFDAPALKRAVQELPTLAVHNPVESVRAILELVDSERLGAALPPPLTSLLEKHRAQVKLLAEVSRDQAEMRGAIIQLNEGLSDRIVRAFEEQLPALKSDSAWERDKNHLDELLALYQEARIAGDRNLQLEALDGLIRRLFPHADTDSSSRAPGTSDSKSGTTLATMYSDIQRVQDWAWDSLWPNQSDLPPTDIMEIITRWDLSAVKTLHEDAQRVQKRFTTALLRFVNEGGVSDANTIVEQFVSVLAEHHSLNTASRPEVALLPIQKVVSDPKLNPFSSENQGDNALLLQRLHDPALRRIIEEDLGIKLSAVPLRSQFQFLRFLVHQNGGQFERLKNALKKHPESSPDIANAFLVCAEDPKRAEIVLRLAEHLPPPEAKLVFSRYNQLALEADSVQNYISRELARSPISDAQILNVTSNLLKRANRVLLDTLAFVSSPSASQDALHTAIERLERAKEENLLFAATFKSVPPELRAKLIGSDNLSISIQKSTELSPKEKQLIVQIGAENSDSTYQNDARYREWTKESLRKGAEDPNCEYYVLRLKGEIVAFLRAVPTSDPNTKYIGSFNADSFYKDSGLGFYFFDKVIKGLGEKFHLEAVAHKDVPALSHYLNDYGFVVSGTADIGHAPGSVYRIRRERDTREQ